MLVFSKNRFLDSLLAPNCQCQNQKKISKYPESRINMEKKELYMLFLNAYVNSELNAMVKNEYLGIVWDIYFGLLAQGFRYFYQKVITF